MKKLSAKIGMMLCASLVSLGVVSLKKTYANEFLKQNADSKNCSFGIDDVMLEVEDICENESDMSELKDKKLLKSLKKLGKIKHSDIKDEIKRQYLYSVIFGNISKRAAIDYFLRLWIYEHMPCTPTLVPLPCDARDIPIMEI